MEDYLSGNLYYNTAVYYDYDNREIIKDDLNFYVEYANKTEGAILELASGTGRVSLYIAEKTGRMLECIELSEYMLEKFRSKLKNFPKNIQNNIHIRNGDMSNFMLDRKYEYIIIPWRALQWLPIREQTIECLNCVYNHLSDNGIFVFDIFKPRVYDANWLGKEDVSYSIIDENKRIIRSTINHYADTEKKYIQYKNKIRILENNVETVKEDMLTIKYYDYNDIVNILKILILKLLNNLDITIKEIWMMVMK
ncbi:MAG: class I SAM-dependent methyltransferase [Treponema sp.]|nr:class I SAM-dependent methyltransferase [Treponema sp.]